VADDTVLVTRPAGQAGPLLQSLQEAGFEALHQPLLELHPLGELPAELKRLVMDLDLYQHVIFISANAVQIGFDFIDDYWPQPPAGLHWYAIGASTAQLLRDRGLDPLVPARRMDSEGLLALESLQQVSGERVLIVKGEGGRGMIRQQLIERGAQVDEFACYRRGCPSLPAGAMEELLYGRGVAAILVSSGEGLENLLRLLSAGETTKFRDIALVVPSSRVAEQARSAGFGQVETADNASDTAMLDALQRWASRRQMSE